MKIFNKFLNIKKHTPLNVYSKITQFPSKFTPSPTKIFLSALYVGKFGDGPGVLSHIFDSWEFFS